MCLGDGPALDRRVAHSAFTAAFWLRRLRSPARASASASATAASGGPCPTAASGVLGPWLCSRARLWLHWPGAGAGAGALKPIRCVPRSSVVVSKRGTKEMIKTV